MAHPNMTRLDIVRPDGVTLVGYYWPVAGARAHVHIAHGMAEHAARYAPLAAVLNAHGYSVTASDHRGHGQTAVANGQVYGHAADRDSWHVVVDDLCAWWQHCHDSFCAPATSTQEIPLFVVGHSLGSFMTLHAASVFGSPVAGIVLSAIGMRLRWFSAVESWLLRCVAKLPMLLQYDQGVAKSELVQWISFGAFNRAFRPNRTGFDWLSRDRAQVDAYINDPLCGQACSVQFWADFLAGMTELLSSSSLSKIASGAPVFLLSGTKDPVGNFGRGAPLLAARLRRAGVNDVKLQMFHEARHELLNETNADEVNASIVAWLDAKCR
jgi:alpha-beta hydrolase superfamily lysophospholipase